MPVTRARLNLLRLTTLTFLCLHSSAINEQGFANLMERAEAHPSVLLGSAASLPAVFSSLSTTIFDGKLPTNAGWQPALLGINLSSGEPERCSSLAIPLIV